MADATNRNLEQELLRTQVENRNLRDQIDSLRRFILSLEGFVQAFDFKDEPVEILQLLKQILIESMNTIDAQDGSLLVLDEDSNELVFVLSHGDVDEEDLHGVRIPAGEGVAGWVTENRTPTIVNNPQTDERFFNGIDNQLDFKTNTLLAAPIIGGDRVLGAIEILNKRSGKQFDEHDQTMVMLMCRFAGELLHTLESRMENEQTLTYTLA